MTIELEHTVDIRERTRVVAVRGEIDLANAHLLEALVLDDAGDEPHIVVDLAAVDYLDSSAMRALANCARTLGDTGRRLQLVAPPGSRAAMVFRVAAFGDDFVVESFDATAGARRDDRPR